MPHSPSMPSSGFSFSRMIGIQPGAGFEANANRVAGNFRNITRNIAAGFGKDPAVRQMQSQILAQQEQQRKAQKQQQIEAISQNFQTFAEAIQASGGQATPAIEKMLRNNTALLIELGEDPGFAQALEDQARTMGSLPVQTEADFQNVLMPDGSVQVINVNDPAAVSQIQNAGGQLMGAAEAPERLLSPEVEAQRARLATAGRSSINIDARPLTEGQVTAQGFADRMAEAEVRIREIEESGFQPSAVEETLGEIPAVGNFLVSPEKQQHDQAKMDFITAVLRKESGAVISEEEFAREDKKYFPQPGDSPEVVEQKRKARARAIANVARQGRRVLPSEAKTTGDILEGETGNFGAMSDEELGAVDVQTLKPEERDAFIAEARRRLDGGQ